MSSTLSGMIGNLQPVMVFGAREDWLKLKKELYDIGKKIDFYVVSSKENNPEMLEDIAVREISELSAIEKKGVIIISNGIDRQAEIYELLKQEHFENIIYGIQYYGKASKQIQSEFQKKGWTINYIEKDNSCNVEEKGLTLYVVTSHFNSHSENEKISSPIVKYIQAGSILTNKRICALRDDEGDNISAKNPYYCELTAGYWIYKNDCNNKYVGFYHYSRIYDLTEKEILNALADGTDVILSEPILFFTARKNDRWCSDVRVRKLMESIFPEYMDVFECYVNDGLFIPSNMFVGKKKIFDEYYQWMMKLLMEYELMLEKENIEKIPRGMGYLAEDLTGIFFLYHMKEWNIKFSKQKILY